MGRGAQGPPMRPTSWAHKLTITVGLEERKYVLSKGTVGDKAQREATELCVLGCVCVCVCVCVCLSVSMYK